MNWICSSTTDKHVGFGKQGGECEGGNCEHLKVGDKAFGESSENDSFGSEVYLYCEPCYNEFLEARRNELTECRDCGLEVPHCEGRDHTPYDSECTHAERMNSKFFVCNTCRELPKHQARLQRDTERRNEDIDEMEADEESFEFEDDPDAFFDDDDSLDNNDNDLTEGESDEHA